MAKNLAPIFPYLLLTLLHFTRTPQSLHPWLIPNSLGPPPPMCSKQSTVAALAQDTFEFNRLLLKSDIIESVVTGDTERVRDPELLDTSDRREAYRRMLPPAVRAQVLSVEGTRVMDASLSAGMVSALDSTRLLSAFPSELTLSQLQRLAVSSAAVCTAP